MVHLLMQRFRSPHLTRKHKRPSLQARRGEQRSSRRNRTTSATEQKSFLENPLFGEPGFADLVAQVAFPPILFLSISWTLQSTLLQRLLETEREIDQVLAKKNFTLPRMGEELLRTVKTLRLSVFNSFTGDSVGALCSPCYPAYVYSYQSDGEWTLHIQGRVEDPVCCSLPLSTPYPLLHRRRQSQKFRNQSSPSSSTS